MQLRFVNASVVVLFLSGCVADVSAPAAGGPPEPAGPALGVDGAGADPSGEGPGASPRMAAPAPPAVLARKAPTATALPTRIAVAPDGRVAVTDARLGTVRVLGADLVAVAQLEGLDRPLGVAWRDGRLLVGLAGSRCVAEYGVDGALLGTVGEGALAMPNDLAVAVDGTLWVADSSADRVVAFAKDGALMRTLGDGSGGEPPVVFPSAVALDEGAGLVWVADQGNRRITAFTGDGAFVRTLGGPAEAFSADWHGRFVTVQGLAIGAGGRVLALDSNLAVVQVLDPLSGDALEVLGGFGDTPGSLRLPLGIAVAANGDVLVTNAGNRRIERLTVGEVAP